MKTKMNKYETEISKYLKQKESNISKANKKSKHKHQYEECLIQYRWNFKSNVFTQEEKDKIHTSLNSYCAVCGKIKGYLQNGKYHTEIEELQKERQKGKPYWVGISDEELYERYHNRLPVFFVKDIYKEKYVDLEQTERNKTNE